MIKKQRLIHKKQISLSTFWLLLICFLFVMLSATTFICFIQIYRSSLYQEASIHSEQAVSQVTNTIENYTSQVKQNLQFVKTEVEHCETRDDIKEVLSTVYRIQNNVVSIMIYNEKGEVLDYYAGGRTLNQDLDENLSFFPELLEEEDEKFSSPHVENLYEGYYPWVATIGCRLDSSLFDETVYIVMDTRFNTILSYVDGVSIGQHGYCFVINEDGTIVYHPQQQLIFSGIKIEEIESLNQLADGVYIQKEMIYSIKNVEGENWKVIGVSYTNEQVSPKLHKALMQITCCSILCLMVAGIIISYFSKKVTNPIKQLVTAMHEFELDTKNYYYEAVHGVLEVSLISSSFAHMVLIIQRLMEQVKREEVILRKSELRALQTQINPHFLYNTLDTIQWLCEQNEVDKAVIMVGAFAKYFRISISRGKEFILLTDEITHARNYLLIQKLRHNDSFTYEFDIDEDIDSFYCNKIILQPLIDNAVIHGLDECNGDGVIKISVTVKEDALYVIVADNGIGMTNEMYENLLNYESDSEEGLGLKNVNDRIHIYFGPDYGIHIDSILDEGTAVMIRLPKVDMQKAALLEGEEERENQ